ncbi:MAG: tryptophan--tRNA ligase, partial [Dissulfurimicrobium sp.]
DDRIREIVEDCRAARLGCVACKKELAEALIDYLAPIQERRATMSSEPGLVASVLEQGAGKARRVAVETMEEVRSAIWSPSAR